jgi:hypothetical protein
MCSHAKSTLLKLFTQSPYFHFIPTSKKHNFLVTVFSMNSNYAVRAPNEPETNRLVKPRARDV